MVEVIPCAPDPHIGESKTLSFLRNRLEYCYHVVLTNYYLPDGNTTLEIDLVVINRFGVWMLEVKDWYGKILSDDIFWRQEGRRPVKSPITSIDGKTKVMHGLLSQHHLGSTSVTGLVVLSRGTQMLEISDRRRDRVFGLDDRLVEALTTEQYQAYHRPPLSRGDINRVRDVLVSNHVNPDRAFIGPYQVTRELRRAAGLIEYEARHTEFARRARIRVFQVRRIVSQKQLAEEVRRFRRDIEALEVAGIHPNLVTAYDFFKDEHSDEFYYLILEWVEGETLADLLDREDTVPLPDQISWVRQLTSALAHVHAKGIVHRNVAPKNIYLAEDGTVKLGGFDLAKVPALGMTVSVTGVPLVEGRYTAPEIFTKPEEVDSRADLYSLGAVWFDLVVPEATSGSIDTARLETTDLPDEVKKVLSRLITLRRADRYQHAAELTEDLEMLSALMT
jgi:eukaryotic-like serine/threonine-protein kinase